MGRVVLVVVLCMAVVFMVSCAKSGGSNASAAEELVDAMARGDFASATKDFDAKMKSSLSPEQLGQVWTRITTQAGAFKGRMATREAHEVGFDTVYVTCQFDKTVLDAKVVFSGGKVSGLWLVPTQPASGGK